MHKSIFNREYHFPCHPYGRSGLYQLHHRVIVVSANLTLQMPIVDGIAATKVIREIESKRSESSTTDENNLISRIPIFAVSASLVERDEFSYIETGFDGWIMKPIHFSRLETILDGVHDLEARKGPSGDRDWEKGGWFHIQ